MIRRSVKWTAAGMAASKSLSLLAKLALARLLVPEHFGFVSMVLVFTQVAKIVGDVGLAHALVQRRRDGETRLLFDSAFWFLLLVAFVMIGFMWLAGVPFIVWFYNEPALSTIAMAMSLGILFQNLKVVPEARLVRTMRFKRIAISELFGTLVGCACAITLALIGAGVWSLVGQVLIAAICTMSALFLSAGWAPRLRFSPSALLGVKDFSSYILGSRAFVYLQQNLDYLLIGKLMGAYAVGIYAIAFLVTETLRAQIYWIVGKVVFPVYSRLLGQAANIRTVYLGTVRYMTASIFPVAMLFILYAGDAIPALFTDRWAGAVDPIRFLAAASMVSASAGTPGEVLRGVGTPKADFRVNWKVTLFVAFPSLWVGIKLFGISGAAAAVLFHYLVSRILFHLAIHKQIHLTALDVLHAIRPAFIGILLMIPFKFVLTDSHWIAAALASLVVYVAVVYPSVRSRLKPMLSPAVDDRAPPSAGERSVIVFLGTDGSGKTTLVENLADASRRTECLYLGLSLEAKWVLPPAHSLYALHLSCGNKVVRSLTGALFWYLLFPLELLCRRILLPSAGSSGMLLVDRLPGRPFLCGGALMHAYRFLLPRPDWAVLLVGDAAIIAGRKSGETNLARTKLEMAKWETVAKRSGAREILYINTTDNDLPSCLRLLVDRVLPGKLTPVAAPT